MAMGNNYLYCITYFAGHKLKAQFLFSSTAFFQSVLQKTREKQVKEV